MGFLLYRKKGPAQFFNQQKSPFETIESLGGLTYAFLDNTSWFQVSDGRLKMKDTASEIFF
jgi:hypothetical protein